MYKKYNNYLATPYIIHTGDYKEDDGIIYLPIYMTILLWWKIIGNEGVMITFEEMSRTKTFVLENIK